MYSVKRLTFESKYVNIIVNDSLNRVNEPLVGQRDCYRTQLSDAVNEAYSHLRGIYSTKKVDITQEIRYNIYILNNIVVGDI